MLRPLTPAVAQAVHDVRVRLAASVWLAVGVMLSVVMLTALGMGLYSLYRIRVELSTLRVQYDTHVKERVVLDAGITKQLDMLYRTLYAPIDLPTPQPRQPSAVEVWQVNRDKELRQRLVVLEQWRLKTSTTLEQLEK